MKITTIMVVTQSLPSIIRMRTLFLISLFIVLVFTSCNDDKSDLVTEQLFTKLQEANDFIDEKNNRILNLLNAGFHENPAKVKPWLELAIREDSLVKDFIIYSDSINSNAEDYNINELLKKYSNYKGHFTTLYKNRFDDLQWNDYDFNNNCNSDYITIQMIYDLLRNESIVLSYIYHNTECAVDYFCIPVIETEFFSSSDSAYTFTLNSLRLVTLEDKERYVIIDSIFYNGNITNLKPDIKYSDILWSIHLDTLDPGTYKIYGKVVRVFFDGMQQESQFEHDFKK